MPKLSANEAFERLIEAKRALIEAKKAVEKLSEGPQKDNLLNKLEKISATLAEFREILRNHDKYENFTDKQFEHQTVRISAISAIAGLQLRVENKNVNIKERKNEINELKNYTQAVSNEAVYQDFKHYKNQVKNAPISRKLDPTTVQKERNDTLDGLKGRLATVLGNLKVAEKQLDAVNVKNTPEYKQAMTDYKDAMLEVYSVRRDIVQEQINLMPKGGLHQLRCQQELDRIPKVDRNELHKPASEFLKGQNKTLSIIGNAAYRDEDPIVKIDNRGEGPSTRGVKL